MYVSNVNELRLLVSSTFSFTRRLAVPRIMYLLAGGVLQCYLNHINMVIIYMYGALLAVCVYKTSANK